MTKMIKEAIVYHAIEAIRTAANHLLVSSLAAMKQVNHFSFILSLSLSLSLFVNILMSSFSLKKCFLNVPASESFEPFFHSFQTQIYRRKTVRFIWFRTRIIGLRASKPTSWPPTCLLFLMPTSFIKMCVYYFVASLFCFYKSFEMFLNGHSRTLFPFWLSFYQNAAMQSLGSYFQTEATVFWTCSATTCLTFSCSAKEPLQMCHHHRHPVSMKHAFFFFALTSSFN